MRLTDAFDHTYIINLPERSDRRRETLAELASAGAAVDGDRVEFFRAVKPDAASGFPSIGCRGCFLSHRNVVEQALNAGFETILVMEDDVEFTPAFGAYAEPILRELARTPWHIAHLGHFVPLGVPLDGRLAVLPSGQNVRCLHCYALRRDVFRDYLRFLDEILGRPFGDPRGGPMFPDGAMSTFRAQRPELITVLAAPSLAQQRSSRTDLHPNSWFDRLPGTRQLATWVRGRANAVKRRLRSGR
jgi:hypothetical protein